MTGFGSAPVWGLGDPGAGGRYGEVAVPAAVPAAGDPLLLAALALTGARHSGRGQAEVVVWSGAADSTGGGMVHRVDCDEQLTVSDLLTQCQLAVEGGSPASGDPVDDGPLPELGMVLDEEHPGESYLPFLETELPVLVHWTRAADGRTRGLLRHRERDLAPRIARDFAEHLAHVLGQLATAEPDLPLGDVELMPLDACLRIVREGATPRHPEAQAGTDATVHGLLAEVARRQPHAVAVVDDTTELTYARLEERAEQLARGLVVLGARPDDVVAVALDRTAELVVVLLAILKAGCTYLPLDLRHPAERRRYTVEHAGAVAVVADPDASASLELLDGVRCVSPGELSDLADRVGADTALPADTDGSRPAYVIYTSGTTGRPKGVVVPHRNVAALVSATRGDFGLGPQDTWTFFHSSAFDFSVWEIWGCLLTGGRLVVVPYWVARDTELFHELVERRGVTVVSQTPSAFAQFIEADAVRQASLRVRLVVLGGEALDVGVLAGWFGRHSASSCRIANMFGITETTVHVTEQTVTPAEVVAGSRSVGRALPGWSLSVRDARGRVLPAGVAGEIHVGGDGVASGYLRQPELTAERFVTDPYGGGRLYRSGDLGRIRDDGRLDHLGRIDSQVKIRGHRIELDEIRQVLLGHPAVAAAAVVLRHGSPGDRDTARIDAYYVLRGTAAPSGPELRRHAATLLPEYMLPATLTRLDAIPLTTNGKTDLAALPEPSAPAAQPTGPVEGVEPGESEGSRGDSTAGTVLALWSRLLNTDVGPHDNFFELGGNSLLVVRLLRELPDHGLPRIAVRDFYRNSDARSFVRLVRSVAAADTGP
ncbi:amino acid adenylation domain-containing protein [Streptomyces sp. NPDC001002]